MSFNTMSYFAGVGTVLAAVTFGLAGGFIMSNPTRKAEPPNRIERVAANAPLANSPGDQAAPVAQPAPAPQDSAAHASVAAAPASGPAPQPVAQQQPPAKEQSVQHSAEQAAAAPAPVVAKDDAAELAKIREADLKSAERKRAHRRWAERQRHQQELDAATEPQVRQIYRGGDDEVVQRVPVETRPRFGLFGNDDD